MEQTARPSSRREIALYRLKAMIEARLCDPALKPAAAAAAAGISVRYANDLLSQEDYSIERYILHRRLERARRALENPSQARRSIGEIAFAWGFSDLSHFVRRFRFTYGLTPGDYRRRAKERAAELASP
jgi:AraC-like DNA-binding protein